MANMNDSDRAFHASMRPNWGPDGTFIYAAQPITKRLGNSSDRLRERNSLLSLQKDAIISGNRAVRFAKVSSEVRN
jgi:nuclear pore complex protein Nup98-Nup96